MFEKIVSKEKSIALVGLGYVGLPLALEFAKKFKVVGFDIKQDRVDMMNNNIDPSRELDSSNFENRDISFTTNINDLKKCGIYIVAVPTPIDEAKNPSLAPLISASETVAKVIDKGDYVIYESTVYPGCTEEDCVPVIEKATGLKICKDFKVGYSPERINPGDKKRPLPSIIKIVSGCDKESLDNITKLYESIITAGLHQAPTIKVAEAAKIIENTQRDLNISLMNELSLIFDKMDINTFDVIEAAASKWNFQKYTPGLVGGHCIGVDPYYLLHKAREVGYHPRVIAAGRATNDMMGAHIAKKIIKEIIKKGKTVRDSKILILGTTFKEDVSDIRNSKIVDIVKELESYQVAVEVVDPHAKSDEVKKAYGYELTPNIGEKYDGVIIAVSHKEFLNFDEAYFDTILKNGLAFVYDLKGIYRKKITNRDYWTL